MSELRHSARLVSRVSTVRAFRPYDARTWLTSVTMRLSSALEDEPFAQAARAPVGAATDQTLASRKAASTSWTGTRAWRGTPRPCALEDANPRGAMVRRARTIRTTATPTPTRRRAPGPF